jgi:hypothetical protein
MKTFFLAPILFLVFTQSVAAYLDPGTGSMILQGLIAGVALAGFTLKTYWYRIRAFFGKSAPKSLLDEDDEPQSPGQL